MPEKNSRVEKPAGTGSGRDGYRIGTIAWTHLALTSSRPRHTRVSSSPERKRHERKAACRQSRTPLVGASALHGVSGTITPCSRSHLGSTLGSGKSCPDPGRLSTFGVSGLYPCRRLTYRGACGIHAGTQINARQTVIKLFTNEMRRPQVAHAR